MSGTQNGQATELERLYSSEKRDSDEEEDDPLLQDDDLNREPRTNVAAVEKVPEPSQGMSKQTIIWMAINIIATVLIVRPPLSSHSPKRRAWASH